jgi:flagellar hook-basal body complex protein FliE
MMQPWIEPAAAVGAASATSAAAAMPEPASNAPATDAFARLFSQGLAEVNSSVGAAEQAMSNLAAGKPVEMHAVMIELERAQLSVQTFVQVRNKLVEAYQDLMRMQL